MKLIEVTVASLRPNPFREIDDYPLDRVKLDALKESFRETGYWGNITCRKKGTKYEIAYGHHRQRAMEELVEEGEWPKSKKVAVICRDLSNEMMLQMMARENAEEYGTDAYTEAQTLESTIRAYGNGEIELPEVERKDERYVRFAKPPSTGAYTMATVAAFLGWTKSDGQPNHKCRVAFEVVDAFAEKIVDRNSIRGVSREIANSIVTRAVTLKREQERIAKEKQKRADEARVAAEKSQDAKARAAFNRVATKLEAESRDIAKDAKKVAESFAKDAIKQAKSGNWAVRDIRDAGAEAKARLRSKADQRYQTAREHYFYLCKLVAKMLNESLDERFKSLVSLMELDCGLEQEDIDQLLTEVKGLQNRAEKFAKKLTAWRPAKAQQADSGLRIVG